MMKITWDQKGTFVSRPNRFLAVVDIQGSHEEVHVHDPGRLKELLYPGNSLLVRRAFAKERRTKWDLIAARHGNQWVLVNSSFHRALSEKHLSDPVASPFSGIIRIQPEVKFGSSRLDFKLELDTGNSMYLEVKGCTLAIDGKALFPDAPTSRGRRHVEELVKAKEMGYDAAMLFLVFRRDAECFAPKEDTDPDFARAFYSALEKGVEAKVLVFGLNGHELRYEKEIPVCKD